MPLATWFSVTKYFLRLLSSIPKCTLFLFYIFMKICGKNKSKGMSEEEGRKSAGWYWLAAQGHCLFELCVLYMQLIGGACVRRQTRIYFDFSSSSSSYWTEVGCKYHIIFPAPPLPSSRLFSSEGKKSAGLVCSIIIISYRRDNENPMLLWEKR